MRLPRPLTALLVVAVLAAGCGLGATPVVSTEDEVLDALLALRDGAEGRLTASLELDEDEVRGVLRDDAEARALLEDQLGGGDTEELLDDLRTARERLAEHAVLLATGADGSGRLALETNGTVWLDLRARSDLGPGDDLPTGFGLDLQARIDWATAAEVLEQPDLLGEVDAAVAEVAPYLEGVPGTAAIQQVLLGLLAGELVAISGDVGPALLDGLGALGGAPADPTVDGTTLPELDLDPRTLAATALSFDDFRRDGDDTLVDVTLELRAAAEVILDQLATAPDAAGLTFEDVEEARAELADLPERLTDVAVLRLGPDGTLRQVRVDVLDAAVQLARATDDPDVAVAERVAAQLDATGLFVVLDVTGVGSTGTVLGDPSASATPDDVVRAVSALLFGGLTGGADGLLELGELEALLEQPAPADG